MQKDPGSPADQCDGAVMFADICDSTRLYDKAGDAVALAAIRHCLGLMKTRAALAQGRVVKTIGDEIMVLFPAADQAMQAALDMQEGVAGLAPIAGIALSIHIGFHHGPILSDEGGDVFGDTVNLAARLVKLASRGQIITSKHAVEQLSAPLRQMTRALYPIQVRGKHQLVELYEGIWQQNTELTLVAPMDVAVRRSLFLSLRYRDTLFEMDATSAPLTIGRDSTMSIVILDRQVSRFQATVEPRGGRFVLIDRSSNGTHVRIDGEDSLMLRRDEITLRGHGWITFSPPGDAHQEAIEFFVEED
ncbi:MULTISPECIES: adenylate/guanylate cyclase domain-containing protein [unclassified Cupriavidus]|uniref:adenylate/guanylate cyclase domain-containing protein n=1 Tax=unclassified Cupriavidus TaxID=2640874 RepID=UPI001E38AB69|nr:MULTISPECIES: adenylate/guanylate cyclase domain-containing protein [unclassified Cupriavidus]